MLATKTDLWSVNAWKENKNEEGEGVRLARSATAFLVGAVNVGFYVINLKFIPVLAAPLARRKYHFSGIARRFGWVGPSQSVLD